MDGWLEVNFGSWVTAVWVALAALIAIWFGGRRSAKTEAKLEKAEEYVETRKNLDEVVRAADADVALERLHERVESKRPVRRNSRSKK